MISKFFNIISGNQQPEPQEEDNLPPHIRQKLIQVEKLLKVTPFDFPDQLRKNTEQMLLSFKSNEDPPKIAIFNKQYEEDGPEYMVFEGKVVANFKGNEYAIQIQIRIPQQFPRDPPSVYLKNLAKDNPLVKINKKYISSELGEYINISKSIVEVVGWFEHQSMVYNLQMQGKETFSTTYPFAEGRRKDDQQIQFHKVQAQVQPEQVDTPIKPIESVGSTDNNPLMISSGPSKQPQHRDIDIFQAKKIQIERDKLKREGEQYLQDLLDVLDNQKRILQEQRKTEQSLDENIKKAQTAINVFQAFNQNNSDIRLELKDVQKYIAGQDALNEQLIEVAANILSLKDLLRLIYLRFKQQAIDLDQLMRLTKKYSEKLYDEEHLLKKIILSKN